MSNAFPGVISVDEEIVNLSVVVVCANALRDSKVLKITPPF